MLNPAKPGFSTGQIILITACFLTNIINTIFFDKKE